MKTSSDDKQVVEQGTPYIRSVLAFILFLRFGGNHMPSLDPYYKAADEFISKLKADMEG